jgi:hypothetical protein
MAFDVRERAESVVLEFEYPVGMVGRPPRPESAASAEAARSLAPA